MDFFEHQDRARRNTGRLVALFGLAVIAIVGLVYALAMVTMPLLGGLEFEGGETGFDVSEVGGFRLWDPLVMAAVSGAVVVVVGLGSAYKIAQLHGGGSVIAEQIGGRPLSPDSSDLNERRVLNVVEEMAIASGIPVPPVYLMDRENGINAFAAGYTPRDAVIGVSRGSIETLSRDELQGVMAHEFSHILNGDMRLNIRLIGILHGILVIGLLGQYLMRIAFYTPGRSRGKGNAPLYLIAFGAGLGVIGFAGVFFGNLIKASVSRQREFLADASAVQFTRNPLGIGGALKKIGGLSFGSRIRSPNAPEASHMFFASGLSSLFATHPPLPTRIRRIDASWDGTFPHVATAWAKETRHGEMATRTAHAIAAMVGAAPAGAGAGVSPGPAPRFSALEEVGTLSQTNMRYASELVRQIPGPVAAAAREPFSARALVLTMLLDRDEALHERQMTVIREHDDGMAREVERLTADVAGMDPRARLPLLDIVIGTLRSLSPQQYEVFRGRVEKLIAADSKRDLFEWVLLRMLGRHLDSQFRGAAPTRVAYYGLQRLAEECRVLLSTLAYAGHRDRANAVRSYEAGARALGAPLGEILDPGDLGLRALGDALDKLEQVSAKLKKQILTACAVCIAADREVTLREGELLRAISDNLDCPMPPLLPGQPLV